MKSTDIKPCTPRASSRRCRLYQDCLVQILLQPQVLCPSFQILRRNGEVFFESRLLARLHGSLCYFRFLSKLLILRFCLRLPLPLVPLFTAATLSQAVHQLTNWSGKWPLTYSSRLSLCHGGRMRVSVKCKRRNGSKSREVSAAVAERPRTDPLPSLGTSSTLSETMHRVTDEATILTSSLRLATLIHLAPRYTTPTKFNCTPVIEPRLTSCHPPSTSISTPFK